MNHEPEPERVRKETVRIVAVRVGVLGRDIGVSMRAAVFARKRVGTFM